jgi:hypothetical protein
MGQYAANAINSHNFKLTSNSLNIGELIYKNWYSFSAEILMTDGTKYMLEPKGFWDAKIELKDDSRTLAEFKMGWNGIIIKTFFKGKEETFLLKLKGLLSKKFVLLDTENEELMVAEANFKWSKLNFEYNIETSSIFDNFDNKELMLLTVLHCINYYVTITAAAA